MTSEQTPEEMLRALYPRLSAEEQSEALRNLERLADWIVEGLTEEPDELTMEDGSID